MIAAPRARVFIAVVAVLAGAALLPSGLTADHNWGRYHWERTTTDELALDVGNNLSGGWGTYLSGAISDWNDSTVLELTAVASNKNPLDCEPTLGRIEACNADYGDNDWLGLAQIWIYRGSPHIAQATTLVNDFYFNQEVYDTAPLRQLVMCQEIAHDFGLDHQDENFDNPNLGTCVDYTSNPEGPPSNEHPNQHDYDQLLAIYDHVDGSGGGGGGGPGGGGPGGGGPPGGGPGGRGNAPFGDFWTMPGQAGDHIGIDDPRQWGRLVRSNGRVALYDLDLGDGRHVFTFVIWA